MSKICQKCGRNDQDFERYKNTCRDCIRKQQRENYKKYNPKAKSRYGKTLLGKEVILTNIKTSRGCVNCNEAYPACLEFHHKDPDSKVGQIKYIKNYPQIVKEIEKCILVCSNCHRKIHGGLVNIDNVSTIKLTDTETILLRDSFDYFSTNRKRRRTLCPEKEVLQRMIDTKTLDEIAATYGISITSLKKWIINLGIKLPDFKTRRERISYQQKKLYEIPSVEELKDLLSKYTCKEIAQKYNVATGTVYGWRKRYIKNPLCHTNST